ncbi:hypothetical protein Daus18300_013641 [Diaporthe australafricana]|uniref:Uncharacterized protein n=1 Tax=Diaporthe australafricana TaxID=127596 RepID=A0ABR3VYB3_9PEZI
MANEEEEQELGRPSALGSEDARIHGLLPFHNKAKFKKFKDEDPPSSFSHNVIVVEGELHTPVEWEPGELPFLKSDIHDLLHKELVSMHGYWSVRFLDPTRAGGSETYGDRFRSVFIFRTVELMVRPLSEENNGGYESPGYLKSVQPRHYPGQPAIHIHTSPGSACTLTLFVVVIIGSALSTRRTVCRPS